MWQAARAGESPCRAPEDRVDKAKWDAKCKSDNDQFVSGQLGHDEYWARVHQRDDYIANTTPEERARLNGVS